MNWIIGCGIFQTSCAAPAPNPRIVIHIELKKRPITSTCNTTHRHSLSFNFYFGSFSLLLTSSPGQASLEYVWLIFQSMNICGSLLSKGGVQDFLCKCESRGKSPQHGLQITHVHFIFVFCFLFKMACHEALYNHGGNHQPRHIQSEDELTLTGPRMSAR